MYLTLLTLSVIFRCIICSTKSEICGETELDENRIFSNYRPKGLNERTANVIKAFKNTDINTCIRKCCMYRRCDAFIFNNTNCDLIYCKHISDCNPVQEFTTHKEQYYMVLKVSFRLPDRDLNKDQSDEDMSTCELNVPQSCPINQICEEIQENRKSGVCVCKDGYMKKDSECIEKIDSELELNKSNGNKSQTTSSIIMSSRNSKKSSSPSTPGSVTRKSTKASSIITSTKQANKNKERNSQTHQFSANAGPDLYIKVLKSSLFDKPEIISIPGNVRIRNKFFDEENFIYSWKRLPESLAVGTIVNNSNHELTLILTNLLQGQYVFELTVTSSDGSQSKDVVKLNVVETEDDASLNLVDIILVTNIYRFTEKDKQSFSKRMAHIIEKDLSKPQTSIEIHSIASHFNNNTHITFYAKMYNEHIKAFQLISSGLLETDLQNKIIKHKFIFDYPIEMFQSRICYNDCGGHGICDKTSHLCICNFPWFNNIFHQQKTGFSNCDMHAMIVVVSCAVGLFILVLLIIIIRKIVKKIRLRNKYGKKRIQYTVLENTET